MQEDVCVGQVDVHVFGAQEFEHSGTAFVVFAWGLGLEHFPVKHALQFGNVPANQEDRNGF